LFFADHQSISPGGPPATEKKNIKPGFAVLPAKARGMHPGLHDHAEEAEFGFA
jgi:hypothetical protein